MKILGTNFGFMDAISERKREIKLHIIAWSVYYLVDFAFVVGFQDDLGAKGIIVYLSTIVFYTVCFYLIVELYKNALPKRIVVGLILSLSSILIFSGINSIWDVYIIEFPRYVERYERSPWNLYLLETWRFSTSGLYAFAYWIYLQRVKDQKLRREAEKLLHTAEIAFLKAQINPHFLFNTLNFVYGNVAEKSDTGGKAILSLTKLLRYSVESTKQEHSSLKKESDAITEYLVLQKLRFDGKTYSDFQKSGLLLLFVIPPLILLSLVENAFKYGIIDDPENPVKIKLQADKEGMLFSCFNIKRLDFTDRETTSVGIANIKRRLKLTYGSSYNLLVEDNESNYLVTLDIRWKK